MAHKPSDAPSMERQDSSASTTSTSGAVATSSDSGSDNPQAGGTPLAESMHVSSSGEELDDTKTTPIMITRQQLLDVATAFCDALATQKPLSDILEFFAPDDHKSGTHRASAIEYGDPRVASFLSQPQSGIKAILAYLQMISGMLRWSNMQFSEYVVDAEAQKVSVKGEATWTAKKTNQSWHECFSYTLDFDRDLKITRYQVWADPGALFLATHGLLEGRIVC